MLEKHSSYVLLAKVIVLSHPRFGRCLINRVNQEVIEQATNQQNQGSSRANDGEINLEFMPKNKGHICPIYLLVC